MSNTTDIDSLTFLSGESYGYAYCIERAPSGAIVWTLGTELTDDPEMPVGDEIAEGVADSFEAARRAAYDRAFVEVNG